MKTISLKLPEVLRAKLDHAAKQQGKTKSDIVRTALEEFFNGRRKPRAMTVAELAGDLLGSAEGPSDLATNAKYLEGYGR